MSMLVIGMILADADPKTIIDKDVLFYRFISFLVSQIRYLRTGRKILSVLFA